MCRLYFNTQVITLHYPFKKQTSLAYCLLTFSLTRAIDKFFQLLTQKFVLAGLPPPPQLNPTVGSPIILQRRGSVYGANVPMITGELNGSFHSFEQIT